LGKVSFKKVKPPCFAVLSDFWIRETFGVGRRWIKTTDFFGRFWPCMGELLFGISIFEGVWLPSGFDCSPYLVTRVILISIHLWPIISQSGCIVVCCFWYF